MGAFKPGLLHLRPLYTHQGTLYIYSQLANSAEQPPSPHLGEVQDLLDNLGERVVGKLGALAEKLDVLDVVYRVQATETTQQGSS